MSAGGAFGGNRGARPVPPEKGVFPLDHLHECDLDKKEYVTCLKTSGFKSEKCRHLSKKYLECRMESCSSATKRPFSAHTQYQWKIEELNINNQV